VAPWPPSPPRFPARGAPHWHPPGTRIPRTYVHWCVRFTRFCLEKLKQTPQAAGIAAITPYLDHLALEERVAPATRKQAFNAIVCLTRKVFGVEDFTIEQPVPATGGNRRPPVVMTRDEVRSVIAHLDGVWKLAALIMYGSGLRLMECLSLRIKDLDFGQGTIAIHDGKGGKHRVVPLPRALERRLTEHLAKVARKPEDRLREAPVDEVRPAGRLFHVTVSVSLIDQTHRGLITLLCAEPSKALLIW
jgi:integrase